MRRRSAFFACVSLFGIGVAAHAAEITGVWRIQAKEGPMPLCNFVQVGNDLTGSCVARLAAGKVTGTVDGQTVRWRWQWDTYGHTGSGVFDFAGTLAIDDAITGVVERRAIGLSTSFTAKRGIVDAPRQGAQTLAQRLT